MVLRAYDWNVFVLLYLITEPKTPFKIYHRLLISLYTTYKNTFVFVEWLVDCLCWRYHTQYSSILMCRHVYCYTLCVGAKASLARIISWFSSLNIANESNILFATFPDDRSVRMQFVSIWEHTHPHIHTHTPTPPTHKPPPHSRIIIYTIYIIFIICIIINIV